MNILSFYRYSWFSTLAYVNWRAISIDTDAFQRPIEDANTATRVPGNVADTAVNTLGEKIFAPRSDGGEGWKVADFQPNDASGFAASLFTKGDTNEKVLAIRGTEPDVNPYLDLLKADLNEIGAYGMAISQAVSLFNYVQRLRAPVSDVFVPQLILNIGPIPPSIGPLVQVSLLPPKYISMSVAFNGSGLGELIKPSDNLVVTGHSLGGHVAAIAYRLFPTLFDGAVTFNAPGFDPTVGVGGWGTGVSVGGVTPGRTIRDR